MEYRLRIYEVNPGAMAAWVDEWARLIRPLREKLGFKVVGAWAGEGSNTFVWVLRYDGADGYEAANAAYYASPERGAIEPNPARHLAATQELPVKPVG